MVADLGSGADPGSWSLDGSLFAVSFHGKEGKGAHWGLSYKGTNPIYKGSAAFT